MQVSNIKLWKVARALGWTTIATLRRFRRAGWCFQEIPRSEWVVARERLGAVMPTVLVRIDELETAGLLKSKRGNCMFGKTGTAARRRVSGPDNER